MLVTEETNVKICKCNLRLKKVERASDIRVTRYLKTASFSERTDNVWLKAEAV